MKKLALSLTALCLTLAIPAFAADGGTSYSESTKIKTDASGDATKSVSESATDANGTKDTDKLKVKVDAGSNGDVTTKVDEKTSHDPKGMGNEVKTEDSKTEKVKADGEYSGKATSETKDAAGATDKAEVKATVSTDKKGLKTKKVKHKTVHDPKGLMNKTTETTTDTATQKPDGTTEVKHETDVNGKATEKTDTAQ